ncbi:TerB family tellurite resistance protein [uncultured Lacinutrix sp.]|uniref:TerB family tellurite resistance protein n=1 Tax=uncultured Lacinutrix sp. TaxID=574032 RepID=UPI00261A4F6C|nr:TerB family tellurite resistance protein [uncultured Lacinutrix sp.]
MSFSDLFDSGFKKRNEDHFAAIVRVAMDDGIITDDEKAFLDRLARNLEISEANYAEILKNYQSHPINPPTSYDRRLERLFDLSRMVYVDHIKGDHEEVLLRKIAVGLGFNPENAKYVVDKALTLVSNGVDLDTFIEEVKQMNR